MVNNLSRGDAVNKQASRKFINTLSAEIRKIMVTVYHVLTCRN